MIRNAIVLALFSLTTQAEAPIALSGAFHFDGRVDPIARVTVDVVDMRMSDSAARLAKLKADGATCRLVVSQTYRCTKRTGPESVPASSLTAIGNRNREVFASFGAQTSPPVLVSEAESLVEWRIPQQGESNLGAFSSYEYLDLQGDLVKILLPAASGTGSLELIVQDATHLAKHDTKNVTESQWRYYEDTALVILEP